MLKECRRLFLLLSFYEYQLKNECLLFPQLWVSPVCSREGRSGTHYLQHACLPREANMNQVHNYNSIMYTLRKSKGVRKNSIRKAGLTCGGQV